MRHRISSASLTAAFTAVLPAIAFAHPGHDRTATFFQGLAHPISGGDHILTMVMVGVLAVQLGGRALWLLPSVFLAAMAAGASAGVSGISPAAIEIGIALSFVLIGAMIVLRRRTPAAVATVLIAAVALVHGQAHGAEAHAALSFTYVAGFLLGTAGFLLAGMVGGQWIARLRRGELIARTAGAAAAGTGVLLLTTI